MNQYHTIKKNTYRTKLNDYTTSQKNTNTISPYDEASKKKNNRNTKIIETQIIEKNIHRNILRLRPFRH